MPRHKCLFPTNSPRNGRYPTHYSHFHQAHNNVRWARKHFKPNAPLTTTASKHLKTFFQETRSRGLIHCIPAPLTKTRPLNAPGPMHKKAINSPCWRNVSYACRHVGLGHGYACMTIMGADTALAMMFTAKSISLCVNRIPWIKWKIKHHEILHEYHLCLLGVSSDRRKIICKLKVHVHLHHARKYTTYWFLEEQSYMLIPIHRVSI